MKKIITLFLLLGTTAVKAQKLKMNSESNLLTIDTVLSLDTMKANVIYTKIKSWAATKFKSPEKVIVSDIPNSEITFRYISPIKQMGVLINFYYSYTIKIKDGKIKTQLFAISDVEYNKPIEQVVLKKDGTPRDTYKKNIKQFEEEGTSNNISLFKALSKPEEKW